MMSSNMIASFTQSHLAWRSGKTTHCYHCPVVSSCHTPPSSWSGVMTRQMLCQVPTLYSVRMATGHRHFQHAGSPLLQRTIPVNLSISNFVRTSRTIYRFPSTSNSIYCDRQFLDIWACWPVDCPAWSNCSHGLYPG